MDFIFRQFLVFRELEIRFDRLDRARNQWTLPTFQKPCQGITLKMLLQILTDVQPSRSIAPNLVTEHAGENQKALRLPDAHRVPGEEECASSRLLRSAEVPLCPWFVRPNPCGDRSHSSRAVLASSIS